MPQFFPDKNDGKFIVFVIGPMGADKDPARRRWPFWRRSPETRISDHTRNIAEAARNVLREQNMPEDTFEVYVPDEETGAHIVNDVFHKIDIADLAIADISNRSPNVFYEIAYFNALGTPLIIFDSSGKDLPFYWRNMRIAQAPELTVAAVERELKPRFEAHFNGQGDLTANPITGFYGAPLVDVSASAGVAVGFFENFAFHLLVSGGVLASRPDLDNLVIIKPSRINNFAQDNKLVQDYLADAKDETADAPTHPRKAVRIKIVGRSIVDFPTPLYALQRAPRYKRLAKQINTLGLDEQGKRAAVAGLEARLIESYFRTLDYLVASESNINASAMRVVPIDQLASR